MKFVHGEAINYSLKISELKRVNRRKINRKVLLKKRKMQLTLQTKK